MKHLKTIILTTILAIALNLQSSAQVVSNNDKTKFSIEIDPATFAFNGYGVHFRLQPKGSEHLLVGFGTYAMNMPDALVNFNKNNKNKGWNVRISQGHSLFGEYHLTEVNRKWFLGTQIGIQEFKIKKANLIGSEKFTNILAMGYFGYTIKPFKNSLYIKPWAGIGYSSKISGSNILGTSEYDIAPITMFATFHIGYTF
jgi:hypothetical protein